MFDLCERLKDQFKGCKPHKLAQPNLTISYDTPKPAESLFPEYESAVVS